MHEHLYWIQCPDCKSKHTNGYFRALAKCLCVRKCPCYSYRFYYNWTTAVKYDVTKISATIFGCLHSYYELLRYCLLMGMGDTHTHCDTHMIFYDKDRGCARTY